MKFSFLTHNQNPKVEEELLKSMKEGDGLNDILGYACLVEGNQHSEHLSKVYLDTVKPSNKTVEAVDKRNKNSKSQGGSRHQQSSKFRSLFRDKRDVAIVVKSTSPSVSLPLANSATIVKEKPFF